MLCKTDDQRAIWDAIEARIDAQPVDGMNAQGFSEIIAEHQRAIIFGMRSARLAAIRALDK